MSFGCRYACPSTSRATHAPRARCTSGSTPRARSHGTRGSSSNKVAGQLPRLRAPPHLPSSAEGWRMAGPARGLGQAPAQTRAAAPRLALRHSGIRSAGTACPDMALRGGIWPRAMTRGGIWPRDRSLGARGILSVRERAGPSQGRPVRGERFEPGLRGGRCAPGTVEGGHDCAPYRCARKRPRTWLGSDLVSDCFKIFAKT